MTIYCLCFFFFFNDTATTEIYTLSLHDALPISGGRGGRAGGEVPGNRRTVSLDARRLRAVARLPQFLGLLDGYRQDRKSTRLNSSHDQISYAVFCLKKKKKRK